MLLFLITNPQTGNVRHGLQKVGKIYLLNSNTFKWLPSLHSLCESCLKVQVGQQSGRIHQRLALHIIHILGQDTLLLQKVAFLQVYCNACLMEGVKVSFPESPPRIFESFPGRDSTVRLWPISHCSCQRCSTPSLCVTVWLSLFQNQTLGFDLSCSSAVGKKKNNGSIQTHIFQILHINIWLYIWDTSLLIDIT